MIENQEQKIFVSAGWDGHVKVWHRKNCRLKYEQTYDQDHLNCVAVSPDGSLCASGGKIGQAHLWDLSEGRKIIVMDANATINNLCFAPNRYWLCAATQQSIRIWDLGSNTIVEN